MNERTNGPINRQLFKKSKVRIIFTGQKTTIIAAKETLGVFSLSGKRNFRPRHFSTFLYPFSFTCFLTGLTDSHKQNSSGAGGTLNTP